MEDKVMKQMMSLAAVVLVLCPLSATVLADPAHFMGLGDLPGGSYSSAAYAVTPDGSLVVGRSESASGGEAYRWTQVGGIVGLGDLQGGPFSSIALDVSADASVVVGQGRNQFTGSAVRWENGIPTDLGALTSNGYSEAWGVSANGSVVVGAAQSPQASDQAFRWTSQTGMTGLGFLSGGTDHSIAYAVSPSGAVIVGASESTQGWQAFKWQNDVMIGLGFVGEGLYSEARDVSADGSVIVGGSNTTPNGGTQAFRWVNGVMTGLGGIPGEPVGSYAQGVSADGSIVVGSAATNAPGGSRAFIWDEVNGMRSVQDVLTSDLGLNLDGWFLNEVMDLSADGNTLVGTGRDPQGFTEAWVAHIPEPCTVILLVTMTPFILGRPIRRRRRSDPRTRRRTI
jgi:probable HAF family extracellular repeat protein